MSPHPVACLEAPIPSGCCWGKSCFDVPPIKGWMLGERPHFQAGLSAATKMLMPLLVLLASSFLAVESTSIAFGTCPRRDWGKETTEEKWECTNGQSSCFSSTVSCSNDGTSSTVGGVRDYDANGNEVASTGGGWDCRQIF